jgi:hypothetical protein
MYDLLVYALLAVAGAGGIDAATSDPQSMENSAEVVSRPGLMPVIQVFSDSRVKRFDVNIILDYDADGRVRSVELEKSTGNERLDRAIREWAKGIVLNTKSAGTVSLPLALSQP